MLDEERQRWQQSAREQINITHRVAGERDAALAEVERLRHDYERVNLRAFEHRAELELAEGEAVRPSDLGNDPNYEKGLDPLPSGEMPQRSENPANRKAVRPSVNIGDSLRNVHTGEVVPVLSTDVEHFAVPSGRPGGDDQTWDLRTLGVDWEFSGEGA